MRSNGSFLAAPSSLSGLIVGPLSVDHVANISDLYSEVTSSLETLGLAGAASHSLLWQCSGKAYVARTRALQAALADVESSFVPLAGGMVGHREPA